MTPEAFARRFHDEYERQAPEFGYVTRTETREFDPTTPNGRLMVAVCSVLMREAFAEERRRCRWYAGRAAGRAHDAVHLGAIPPVEGLANLALEVNGFLQDDFDDIPWKQYREAFEKEATPL